MAARRRAPAANMSLFPLDDDVEAGAAARKTKAAKKSRQAAAKKKKAAPQVSAAHRDVEQQLQRALGTRVVLVDKGGAGTITIGWHGYDHLEALRAKLGR